ncbi:MAG: hypothetical protein ACJA1L_000533 [Paracoccaceae bacterium]
MLAPPIEPADACVLDLGIFHLGFKASCFAAGTISFLNGAAGIGFLAGLIGFLVWGADACAEAREAQLKDEMTRWAPISSAGAGEGPDGAARGAAGGQPGRARDAQRRGCGE